MQNEKINIAYKHQIDYENMLINTIGASLTIRTLDAISGDTAYVKKFGTQDPISDLTDLSNPVANATYKVYALDGTLLGSRISGGAFVDGSTVSPAQGTYIDIEASGGAAVMPATIVLTSVTYPVAGKAYVVPAETVADGDTLRLYEGMSESTYYDSDLKYIAERNPGALNQITIPFNTITDAYSALNSANDGVVVLDSESYNEEIDLDRATTFVQASLGETPTITNGVGAKDVVSTLSEYNNLSAIYFNNNGDDANNGKWGTPKKTISDAITNRGALAVVYGGLGAVVSDTFTEDLAIDDGCILDCDYGYLITIKGINTGTLAVSGFTINNFKLDGNGEIGVIVNDTAGANYSMTLKNCDIFNATSGIRYGGVGTGGVDVQNCKVYNTSNGFLIGDANNKSVTILKNHIFDNITGIYLVGSNASIWTLDVQNNIMYNNAGYQIRIETIATGFTANGAIDHNTLLGGLYGIFIDESPAALTLGASIDNNIIEGMSNHGIFSDTVHTVDNNVFYDNAIDYNVNITSTNEILTDPKLCKKSSPFKLGISADSSAYRTASDSDDIGAILRIVEINAINIIINGFNIDGQNQYNNAIFILDTVNHIGNINKWCSIYDFQGIAGDPYDDDTNTECQFLNCKMTRNGNAIKFSYGGNTVQECLIYNNTVFGVWGDFTLQTFNHNVLWGNQYGLYLESNTSVISIKNSIFAENSLFGIYSEVSISITYCCIIDSVNNVDISSITNITDDPLFINTNEGGEDFNIKTVETGFIKDSPCKDRSDDVPAIDIGAYEVDRSVENDFWRVYPLVYNPRNIDFMHNVEGLTKFVNAKANLDLFGKDDKRQFLFKYNQRQWSDETDRKKLEYITNRLVKSRANSLIDINTIIRISFLPSQNLLSGTGTIDATAKSITDAVIDLVEDEWRGFFAGVQFQTGTATGTIAGKVLTVSPSPVWTVDEWIGFYFHYQGYWYYILSNTADALTLSDPENRLSNISNIDWNIEKYFKVSECFEDGITLIDDDSELVSGSFTYYIGFIEVVIAKPKFKFTQPRFFFQQENWKTGYQILFQET